MECHVKKTWKIIKKFQLMEPVKPIEPIHLFDPISFVELNQNPSKATSMPSQDMPNGTATTAIIPGAGQAKDAAKIAIFRCVDQAKNGVFTVCMPCASQACNTKFKLINANTIFGFWASQSCIEINAIVSVF